MFGWFAPKCPVTLVEKTWIEWRLCWLAKKLGMGRLLQAEVLFPNDEHFLFGDFAGTVDDAHRFLKILAQHMGVNTTKVDLQVVQDMPGAAGQYEPNQEKNTIRVSASQLADPQLLLATLAHELSHEILLGGGFLTPETLDHEWLTDLTMVYLGVGIFAANVTLQESSGYDGGWSWWWMAKQGYLPAHLFGYAMALVAFMRPEEPDWVSRLRPDAAAALQQGLRFLRKSKDALFHPDSVRDFSSPITTADRIADLNHGSPTVRLANLWEISDQKNLDPDLAPALQKCLTASSEAIVAEALRLLARLGQPPAGKNDRLLQFLLHGSAPIQAAAAYALGRLQTDPPTDVQFLADLLQQHHPQVIQEACQALCQFGPTAASTVPKVLAALPTAFREGDQPGLESLLRVLLHLVPDGKQVLRKAYAKGDPELYEHFLGTLKDQHRLLQMEQENQAPSHSEPAFQQSEVSSHKQ